MGGAVRPRDFWPWRALTRHGPVFPILAVGIALALAVFFIARRTDEQRVLNSFELRADWRAQDFDHRIAIATDSLRALAVFIAGEPQVTAAEFHRFARLDHVAEDANSALVWAPWVAAEELPAFHAAARADAGGDIDITERAPDDSFVAASARADYLPVLYEESFDGIPGIRGIDLMSLAERRSRIERARDEGRPIATPPIQVFTSSGPSLGILVIWPVYRTGEVPATQEERRAAFRGVAMSRFRIDRLIPASLAASPKTPESIEFLMDRGRDGGPAQTVANYDAAADRINVGAALDTVAPGSVSLIRAFDLLGQHWTLVSHVSPAAIASLRPKGAWAWLALGLLLTALVANYFERERSRRRGVEAVLSQGTVDLTHALDALHSEAAERERAEHQLVQAQKMEAIGNLTGGMAHDFNNLLGVIIGNLDLLRRQIWAGSEAAELAGESLDAALRGAELTRRLLAFARRQPLEPARVGLNELAAGMVKLLCRTLGEQIVVSLDLAPDLWPVIVDPAQLEASLANLANNARDAMPSGGRLMIATGNRELDGTYSAAHPDVPAGSYAMLEVSDTGTGMTAAVVERIFEPFYTTKERGRGTGLGLSMVFGFMKQSGGHINVYSEPGVGTTFRLYLPRATEGALEAVRVSPLAPPRAAGETVIAVEDNAALRRVVVRQLKELGYRVIEAEGAGPALAVMEREKVDLLFTDIVMPGSIDGFELARRVTSRWPAVKVVLTSGFSEAKLNGHAVGNAVARSAAARVLSKPYRQEELAHALREVLDA